MGPLDGAAGGESMTAGSPAHDTTALGFASVINGLFAYAYTVLGLRAYGPEAFAPIALVWSVWSLAYAATTFPVQHWVNWRGESDGGLGRVRAAMPALGGYVAAVAVTTGALLWATVPTFRDELVWASLPVVLILGSAALGFGRGVLAARGEYRRVAAVIGTENAIRFIAAAVVVALGWGVVAFGWALAIGPIVLAPLWRRLQMEHGADPAPFLIALGGLSIAVVIAQGFVQLGPVATEWLSGSETEISAVFASFALLRAPVLVALGAVTRLTTPLTAMVEDRDTGRLGRLLRAVAVATLIGGPLVFLFGLSLGPNLVEMLFGDGTAISGGATGATALGMWLAVIGLVLLVLHVASNSTREAFVVWGVAGILALIVALASDDPVAGVTGGFVTGEIAAVVGSISAHAARYKRWQRAGPSPTE